jgi:hypothetical protein
MIWSYEAWGQLPGALGGMFGYLCLISIYSQRVLRVDLRVQALEEKGLGERVKLGSDQYRMMYLYTERNSNK